MNKLVFDKLAFDRSTVRTIDSNGHLHVSLTNISKANVCDYFGKEIPGWQELGLEENKIYKMLRHPEELAKAAQSFNGKPLLDIHIPSYSDDHPKDHVIGAVGTNAEFDGTYLKNSLAIWTDEAKKGVESNKQREISCSYGYDPDMTPGIYNGVPYDGIMRNIHGNHVSLVPAGRAGSDVLVADSFNVEIEEAMKKKVYTKSVLAQLAQDKKVDKVEDLLALLAADEENEEEKKSEKKADDEETDEEKAEREKKEAEDEEEEKKKAEDEEEEKAEKKEKAMDARIAKAKEEAKAETKAEMRAMHEAVELVKPWVGQMVAMDSAEEVYKSALELKKVALDGIHPSAYRSLVQAHMQIEDRPVPAMDAKSVDSFYDIFKGADRIKPKRG